MLSSNTSPSALDQLPNTFILLITAQQSKRMSSLLYLLSQYRMTARQVFGISPGPDTLHTLPLMCQTHLWLLSGEIHDTVTVTVLKYYTQQLSTAPLPFSKMTLLLNMISRKRAKQIPASTKRILSLLFYVYFFILPADDSHVTKAPAGKIYPLGVQMTFFRLLWVWRAPKTAFGNSTGSISTDGIK